MRSAKGHQLCSKELGCYGVLRDLSAAHGTVSPDQRSTTKAGVRPHNGMPQECCCANAVVKRQAARALGAAGHELLTSTIFAGLVRVCAFAVVG